MFAVTLGVNLTAHHINNSAADRKTKACAFVSPGHKAVNLGEWLKDVMKPLRIYSDPSICNGKSQPSGFFL
ncbi:hypothetical protein D3C73_1222550 [compost metagenome]